jgi:hypothetical protein
VGVFARTWPAKHGCPGANWNFESACNFQNNQILDQQVLEIHVGEDCFRKI